MSEALATAFSTASSTASSRIIPAEALRKVSVVTLAELEARQREPAPLRPRDLDTEIGRAAYAMGRRRGHDEGWAKGQAQGYREGSQAFEDFKSRAATETTQRMQALLAGFGSELARVERQLAEQVVALAIDIAREVLRREVAADPTVLLAAATEALQALGEGASLIELHVSPQDAPALRTHLQLQPGTPAWTLREDASLQRGGWRAETDTGSAEARIESRWRAVLATLGQPDAPLTMEPA